MQFERNTLTLPFSLNKMFYVLPVWDLGLVNIIKGTFKFNNPTFSIFFYFNSYCCSQQSCIAVVSRTKMTHIAVVSQHFYQLLNQIVKKGDKSLSKYVQMNLDVKKNDCTSMFLHKHEQFCSNLRTIQHFVNLLVTKM